MGGIYRQLYVDLAFFISHVYINRHNCRLCIIYIFGIKNSFIVTQLVDELYLSLIKGLIRLSLYNIS